MDSNWGHFVDTEEDMEYLHKKEDDNKNNESNYESEYESEYDYDMNYCSCSICFNIILIVIIIWHFN